MEKKVSALDFSQLNGVPQLIKDFLDARLPGSENHVLRDVAHVQLAMDPRVFLFCLRAQQDLTQTKHALFVPVGKGEGEIFAGLIVARPALS